MAKPLHPGKAAQNGLLAARLAARGFTSDADILMSKQGFADTQSTTANPQAALAEREQPWVVEALFKYHAACYLTHASIEAANQLRRENELRADDVEAVRRLPTGPALAAGGGGGKARGRVYGGNLVLVHYATGTRFMPDLGRAILFLEEVAEEPYKIDGMLSRLTLEGTLRRLRGVVLGSFTACVPKRGRRELPTPVVLRDHLARLGIPVLSGIPAGHGKRNRPVPLGALATLDARRRVLRFEEGLVS